MSARANQMETICATWMLPIETAAAARAVSPIPVEAEVVPWDQWRRWVEETLSRKTWDGSPPWQDNPLRVALWQYQFETHLEALRRGHPATPARPAAPEPPASPQTREPVKRGKPKPPDDEVAAWVENYEKRVGTPLKQYDDLLKAAYDKANPEIGATWDQLKRALRGKRRPGRPSKSSK